MQHLQKLLAVLLVVVAQVFYGQQQEYEKLYNEVRPKLLQMAKEKKKFYDNKFGTFYRALKNKNINAQIFFLTTSHGEKPEVNKLILYILGWELESYAYKNKLAIPEIRIYFKEAVPWETQREFKKYRGDWKEEALPLIENYTIEKIEFSDILGMKELYRKPL